jgi:acyl-coenzyme A thioesterase PaaI-like protein
VGVTIFDEATAVRGLGGGLYDVLPDQRFAVVAAGGSAPPAVNGGVLIATALRAVLDSSPHPHPVATSAHFVRVARLEPAQVQVTWLKQGKTAATARATLIQDSQPVLDLTVTAGTLAPGPAVTGGLLAPGPADSAQLSWTGPPPDFPPIEECVDLGPWPGTVGADGTAGYAAQVALLLDPATTGWQRGEPSGVPEVRGYFRLREDREPDAYLLALAVDGLPPVVFGLGATGWAPTVELTWHMRAVPSPGPLRVASRCRHVGAGWFDEEAEVWDAAGQLVAQSRQIARVGRGRLRGLANGSAPNGSAPGDGAPGDSAPGG